MQAKRELGTLFGNNAENTAVGITGDCEFVCLDGPSVVVRLTGRFWHEKTTVREGKGARVGSELCHLLESNTFWQSGRN